MKTLEIVKKELSWLGRVISLETIGKYQIATYISDSAIRSYTGYIEGVDTSYTQSFTSLDECLLYLITEDAKLANYMLRMIEK